MYCFFIHKHTHSVNVQVSIWQREDVKREGLCGSLCSYNLREGKEGLVSLNKHVVICLRSHTYAHTHLKHSCQATKYTWNSDFMCSC